MDALGSNMQMSVRLTAGQRAFWVRPGYEVNWLRLHLRNAFFQCILTNDFNDHKTENGKMHKNNEYRNKNECINCTFDWKIPFIYIIVIKIDGYNELIAHIYGILYVRYIIFEIYKNIDYLYETNHFYILHHNRGF